MVLTMPVTTEEAVAGTVAEIMAGFNVKSINYSQAGPWRVSLLEQKL